MSVIVNNVVDKEGISGPDNICTLHPFEVIRIVGEEPKKEPQTPIEDSGLPQPPKDITKDSIIQWVADVLQYIKEHNL